VNGVGGDCPGKTELHPGVLRRAAVFVEYEPQTRIEGDLQQMEAAFPVTEIWRVLQGASAGRTDAGQVTVFDSVGFALEDYSALRFMRDNARALGLGQPLALVPTLADAPRAELWAIEDLLPDDPVGPRGAGEIAVNIAVPAIANAVSAAIGMPVDRLPVAPDDLLDFLERQP